ncbi:conserved membrane hypothetical protein [Tenacibaculum litopenaei]|uniref:CPBP family intramembrane glutamic endopeptidase n=1 Tax=Tenacibaculum litopenaei TaxID=396016 RepID=UPI0038950E47
MKISQNTVLKTSFLFITYYLLNAILSATLYLTLGKEIIETPHINADLLLLIDTFVYSISFLFFYFIIFRKENYINDFNKRNILPQIITVCSLILFYRILIAPFYRVDIIMGIEQVPDFKESISTPIKNTLTVLNTVLIIPFLEELVFRKFILGKLRKQNSMLFAILFSSFLFSLNHLSLITINYSSIFNSFFLGIILGVIFVRYGLLYSIIAHIFFNLLWFLIKEYSHIYWNIERIMNFNLLYFTCTGLALFIIIVLVRRLLKTRD